MYSAPSNRRWQPVVAALLLGLLVVFFQQVQALEGGRTLAFALCIGTLFGLTLQRSRFCFYCHARDWFEDSRPQGVLAILLALAVGLSGMTVVISSWVATPAPGLLPPDMHIGPVSTALVLAGLAFGAGMAVSGSCISAHWYRLAEGSPTAPFALIGTALGFGLGFLTWNALYSASIAEAPVVWLPAHLGHGWALLLQLAVLAILAAWVWKRQRLVSTPPAANQLLRPPASLRALWAQLWSGRWPYWTGGLLIGLLCVAAIVRMRPLGVTATLGSHVREWGTLHGWLPQRLHGLDSLGGCATLLREVWHTPNALVLVGLIAGAFIAALASRQFAPQWPQPGQIVRGLLGGVLLGWGAMTGLGCTIGTVLSGTMAGALSGWVFSAAMVVALAVHFRLRAWRQGKASAAAWLRRSQ